MPRTGLFPCESPAPRAAWARARPELAVRRHGRVSDRVARVSLQLPTLALTVTHRHRQLPHKNSAPRIERRCGVPWWPSCSPSRGSIVP